MNHTKALESLINNLINGNLTTAKKQAKRLNFDAIVNHFTESGWSNEKALRAAAYLKHPSQNAFQAYCDAV